MTDTADYETLLRSMSALSQQFSQRRSRPAGTPPNTMLNQRQSRSRVTKPRSTNASPSHVSGLRRRAPLGSHSQQYQGPATYLNQQPAAFSQPYHSQTLSAITPNHFYGASTDPDRPRSWHADMQMPSSWIDPPQQDFIQSNDMSSAYLQMGMPAYPNMDAGFNTFYPNQPSVAWMQAQMNYCPPYSLDGGMSMPAYNLAQPALDMPSTQEPQREDVDSESDDSISESDDDGELIGMGLYDKSSNVAPSLLFGGGEDEHEASPSAGKGLQLEETWAPPADEVPETEADEGSDTPITSDFQDWTPPFNEQTLDVAQGPYYQMAPQVQQPADIYEANMFFDNDGNLMTDEMLADHQKDMSMGQSWYAGHDWVFPTDGYSHYY